MKVKNVSHFFFSWFPLLTDLFAHSLLTLCSRLLTFCSRFAQGKYPNETPHGTAWGVFTWNGETDGKEKQVRGTYKRVWKYLKE